MNRGSPAKTAVKRLYGLASMRPRFMNRGSAPWGYNEWQEVAASMRPRFMNRGSQGERQKAESLYNELQ